MNAEILRNELICNQEAVEDILTALGFEHIRDCGHNFRFPNIDGDNPTAISLWKDNLVYQNFTRNKHGNLFTLVMDILQCSFPTALEFCAKHGKIQRSKLNQKRVKPFRGFYKKFHKSASDTVFDIKTYDESLIEDYTGYFNTMWLNDGVSFETQEKFNIGYSIQDNAITIPIYNTEGRLVGCKARTNDSRCPLDQRWWAIIPFRKTQVVYGYHTNYCSIIEKNICVIGEAEKFVCQLDSMNCHVGLAIMGHELSKVQTRYIKGLQTKKIILAYDEGISEDILRSEAEKLKIDTPMLKNQVGYIYDKDNKYLSLGSKDSPSDLGKSGFCGLIKECVTWI